MTTSPKSTVNSAAEHNVPSWVNDNLRSMATLLEKPVSELIPDDINEILISQMAPLILILQMGKVGSTAIYEAVKKLENFQAVHIHHLDPKRLNFLWGLNEERGRQQPPNFIKSKAVLDVLDVCPKPMRIISAVRDPVARNLSAFYENLNNFLDVKEGRILNTPQEATEIFVRTYRHLQAIEWFELNIRSVFSLDVYQKRFNRKLRKLQFSNENAKILILRAEDEMAYREDAINTFLNIEGLKLESINTTDDKYYANHYREARDMLILPENLLDDIYNSTFMRHFYSEQECAAFRKKWSAVK